MSFYIYKNNIELQKVRTELPLKHTYSNPVPLPSPLYHVIQFLLVTMYLIFQLIGKCYIEEDYSFCAIHTIMQILLRCTLKSP